MLKCILGIVGANLLLLMLWFIVEIVQRACGRNKGHCVRCGAPGGKYSIRKIEGLFCKHCWYELVEAQLWFAEPEFGDENMPPIHDEKPEKITKN